MPIRNEIVINEGAFNSLQILFQETLLRGLDFKDAPRANKGSVDWGIGNLELFIH
jgi:hypothetical protein